MRKLRSIIVLLCSLVLALAIAGCSSGQRKTPAAEADDGKTLVVGCDDYSPFTYSDEDGNVTGIDVEIITEAMRRAGYEAKCVYIDWEKKDELLESGNIDCIASCFSMSGRESKYRWAGPYMKSRQVVAVAPESDIKTLADLKGKTVAVRSTTKSESALLDGGNDNIPDIEGVFSFADRAYLAPALLKGYVDALASHEISILQYEKDYGVDLRILDEPLLETGVGFAFALNDGRGIDGKVSAALEEMRSDGTMRQIVSRYLDDPDPCLDLAGIDE